MEGLSARHSHSHHTLVSELPDPSNSHGDNTVKEGKSHTPGQTFHWNINQKKWKEVLLFLCVSMWLIDFSFFLSISLEVPWRKMFQTVHVYLARLFKQLVAISREKAWFGVFLPYHNTTRKCEQERNFVLLSLLVSQGILWYLMSLCSKQLLDFAEITRIFI